MLGLISIMSLTVIGTLIILNPRLNAYTGLDKAQLMIATIPPILLLMSLVSLFMRTRYALAFVLGASTLHLGLIIINNAVMLVGGELPSEYTFKVTSTLVRTAIELGIVYGIMLSKKTRNYLTFQE